MRIILSAAISADGYLDSLGGERLILSSPEDWRAVYNLRAECDAILVGAETLRQDNPSLVIRSGKLRRKRVAEGRSADIMKVTVSGSGKLDPKFRFFTEGDGEKVVFTHGTVCNRISELSTVISRPELTAAVITSQLRKMNVGTLMVEGGSSVLSMFLRERNWDEFRLAVAPIFVGNEHAPRLVLDGDYPPMTLVKTENLGQTAVLHFVNRSQHRVDCHYMTRAVDNSLNSAISEMRYRVGAVVVTKGGVEFEGYTGETAPENHAEEEAISKALGPEGCEDIFDHRAVFQAQFQNRAVRRSYHSPRYGACRFRSAGARSLRTVRGCQKTYCRRYRSKRDGYLCPRRHQDQFPRFIVISSAGARNFVPSPPNS